MAETITWEDLLQKIADSEEFRTQLIDDPKAALTGLGVKPTRDMIEGLEALDKAALQKVAAAFPRSGVHADTFGIC